MRNPLRAGVLSYPQRDTCSLGVVARSTAGGLIAIDPRMSVPPEPIANVMFLFLFLVRPLLATISAATAERRLPQKPRSYKDFRAGDVAEWLKAAVC